MRFLVAAFTTLLAVAVSRVQAAPAGAAISSLPGWSGALPFNAYGGYFPVNDGQKQLFYFFAEALNNSATAPVLLWLNGGPGCSSFDGMIYENGPFSFTGPQGAQQQLTLNPYSWNTVANVIYLDSPAGVGLSYSTDPNDYQTNDDITAKDSHQFLLNFFAAYPEFAKNDFYIAGESYAGIYVPTLANQVMLGNQQNQSINLKGILVGNGVSDAQFDGNAFIPFVTGHGWVDIDTETALNTYCQGNYYNNTNQQCNDAQNAASNDVAGLNVYNPYGECSGSSVHKLQTMDGPITDVWTRVQQRTRDHVAELVGGSVPCVDSSAATNWLNLDSVRAAIHAIPVSQQAWTICADQLQYSRTTDSTLSIHRSLLSAGVRVLVYSGDTDMCVPYTGSEAWTRSLGYTITDAWRSWTVGNQVAGYVQGYQGGLTFATVKGAGHMVPQFRPPQALQMLTRFINNQPF